MHFGGTRAPPPPKKICFKEFSIRQAKNSNSSNGGAPPKILAITLCPPKFRVTDRLWSYLVLELTSSL